MKWKLTSGDGWTAAHSVSRNEKLIESIFFKMDEGNAGSQEADQGRSAAGIYSWTKGVGGITTHADLE
jgi:hypothetical protein